MKRSRCSACRNHLHTVANEAAAQNKVSKLVPWSVTEAVSLLTARQICGRRLYSLKVRQATAGLVKRQLRTPADNMNTSRTEVNLSRENAVIRAGDLNGYLHVRNPVSVVIHGKEPIAVDDLSGLMGEGGAAVVE